jgi:hypothetical protein
MVRFEHRDLIALASELIAEGETGDAGADNRNRRHEIV